MSYHYTDYIHTKLFTPKEAQVELCEAVKDKNTIVSFINQPGKNFICCQIIEHFINYGRGKVILYVINSRSNVSRHADFIKRLSCFSVVDTTEDKNISLAGVQVIVATLEHALNILEGKLLNSSEIGLLVLHECHQILHNNSMQKLVSYIKSGSDLRILGIAGSLLQAIEIPYLVETEVALVEKRLNCTLNTESDCITILQQSAPKDILLEYNFPPKLDSSANIIFCQLVAEVAKTKEFLEDHHFELGEYHGCEADKRLMPSPTELPLRLLDNFLYVLHNFGLCAADVASYVILTQVEFFKERTPYERHFLLLGIISSLFVKFRALLDQFFMSLTVREKIFNYSNPILLRLFDIIKNYREKTEPYYPQQVVQTDVQADKNEESEVASHINNDDNNCDNKDLILMNDANTPLTNTAVPEKMPVVNKPIKRSHWCKGTRRRIAQDNKEPIRPHEMDPHTLCGLVFVNNDFAAKVLFYLLCELKKADTEFAFLRVQFTVAISDSLTDSDLEYAYKRQEQALRNFRIRECNLLISTSFLEFGIELPRCNLVVRLDPPNNYQSYAHGKARARGTNALYVIMTHQKDVKDILLRLASFYAIEQILTKSKGLDSADGDVEAELYNCLVKRFRPAQAPDSVFVDLNNAISQINRYCAKLPSDTFTRLTPLWRIMTLPSADRDLFICVLRLPINCSVKKAIIGPAMPTKTLARKFAAMKACLTLHAVEELDDTLMPITKEDFWRREDGLPVITEEDVVDDDAIIRPGTTKRRQYYNKKIAECLTDCRPVPGEQCYLYHISMKLTCALPEEQNTRGRKIRAPEESDQGFGILISRPIPAVGVFPIFTRAGEVAVELKLANKQVILTQERIDKIVPFINFTFTSVLRLQKYLMMFDPDASENSYFIVPTLCDKTRGTVEVDWTFLSMIYKTHNQPPEFIPDHERNDYVFDVKKFEDAVVCPWYRNQDQPQYFYVAEICHYLTPKAPFPGADYNSFETYYFHKYGIRIQNLTQALLDVDHTSARLNFLTPRYVNRKGVALPTTSEAKKRARRENLEQKQILVPELCNIHPFPASLWQKAVCLPCILHRLNALLLANEVRQRVAQELGLGNAGDPDIVWSPLDFGWNLADVLRKSKMEREVLEPEPSDEGHSSETTEMVASTSQDPSIDMEIGMWNDDLGNNVVHADSQMRYGSPTTWLRDHSLGQSEDRDSYDSVSEDYSDSESDSDTSLDEDGEDCGLRIQFKTKDVAEAVDLHRKLPSFDDFLEDYNSTWECAMDENNETLLANKANYEVSLRKLRDKICQDGIVCKADETVPVPWNEVRTSEAELIDSENDILGTADNTKFIFHDSFKDKAKGLEHAQFLMQSVLKNQLVAELCEKYGDDDQPQQQHADFHSEVNDTDFLEEDELHLDNQPDLDVHPGPSPSLILQALTMSNANDGINLERMETIGDSFLKYAITTYLYCSYPNVHEGKLSHLRSKQVSNLNLYRLGKQKVLAESMIATKFEPHDNWLPPCYFVPRELERALIDAGLPPSHWNRADLPALHNMTQHQIAQLVKERSEKFDLYNHGSELVRTLNSESDCFIPYNLITQHSIPDKSIADCVEALIGAYLVACGPRGALLFMSWLGIKVLPRVDVYCSTKDEILNLNDGMEVPRELIGHTTPQQTGEPGIRAWKQTRYGILQPPEVPLLRNIADPEAELNRLLTGFEAFESEIRYRFRERSYLLQAVTHASYSVNQLTDCYQRLEFLGDAVLDYLITRYLFEDPRHHSPGSLTDLRSALVNNTMFASLAVRHGFHKFFRHQCPALHQVIDRFVRIQQENNHAISDECYLVSENDSEEAEDVEVPKALGDVFESIAGAVYLDSGMSLDAVWRVYFRIMKPEIETFSTHVPKSPIRELLELEPETAQFGKPEKLADGRRVRVSVEVFGKGIFKGIGRNYRIAKCTAAKCALKQLKRRGLLLKD